MQVEVMFMPDHDHSGAMTSTRTVWDGTASITENKIGGC